MRKVPVVLALDDDDFFRKMMEKVLYRLGFTVKAVGTIEKFREAEADLEPDLYLIDLNLGPQDGLQLIEELKAGPHANRPIMVVSGNGNPSVVTHALEIGASDFILKPFNRSLLAAKLGQFVRTEEIAEQEKLVEADDLGAFEAKLSVDFEVLGVDELGLTLRSPHLVPKGTVFRLAGNFLGELGVTTDCLVCVISTSLEAETQMYEMYVEFESPEATLMHAVRTWLGKQLAA